MENRRALNVVFISAENEDKLQTKLFDLSLETAKTPDVITIYPKGSKVYAWVKIESKYLEVKASKPEEKIKKKKKKRTKKKVS